MNHKLRNQFFTFADWLMPLWLKLIPYKIGFIICKNLFLYTFKNSKLWVRNSVQRKTLVFGLSDLDLTFLTDYPIDRNQFSQANKKVKFLVPFLGEINFYQNNHFEFIAKTINSFELERDHHLQSFITHTPQSDEVEKVVFLLRMLRSDKALLRGENHYRQNKWRDHFRMLNLSSPPGMITAEIIIKEISHFFSNKDEIFKTLGTWLSSAPWRDDLYHDHFGEHWKFLNPHLYLWFEKNDEQLALNVSELEKNILKRQIDWELFGLYSQRLWLDMNSVNRHVERLEKCLSYYKLPTENILLFREIMN
jgi:hypothetical protein